MTSGELNAILDRGICYSKIEKTHRILVTGMNPSFRQGDPARENSVCEYEYQGIVEGGEDRYFLAFDKLFPGAYKQEVAYMDLLNFRETDQNTVWKFCKDPKGLELVAGNLRLSQLFIEQVVRPRLIMVKVHGASGARKQKRMKISGWDTASNTWNHSPAAISAALQG